MIRTIRAALAAVVMAVALAGCGGGGLTAEQVADELNGVFPVPNPRDNTDFCEASGCEQLVTTDPVSIYQWPDEAGAQRQAQTASDMAQQVHQAGPFVLRFADDRATSDEAIAGWSQRLDQLVAQQG